MSQGRQSDPRRRGSGAPQAAGLSDIEPLTSHLLCSSARKSTHKFPLYPGGSVLESLVTSLIHGADGESTITGGHQQFTIGNIIHYQAPTQSHRSRRICRPNSRPVPLVQSRRGMGRHQVLLWPHDHQAKALAFAQRFNACASLSQLPTAGFERVPIAGRL